MLEGLEVSEVRFSELESELRIDSEVYNKQYLSGLNSIRRKSHTTFGNEAKIIKKGIFNINSSQYCDSGIPFVRISNLKNMIIDDFDMVFISEFDNNQNKKTELQAGDIILSKTAIPTASIVTVPVCNSSQDTVAIKLRKNSVLNSYFVVVFLNTKYGIEQMKHRFTGNIQMHLNLEECKTKLLIPVFSENFQNNIEKLFKESIEALEKSKSLYAQAESLLLSELGMSNPSENSGSCGGANVSIKRFSDVSKTGRLDSEYYQKKYDLIEEKISHLETLQISEIGKLNDKNFSPEENAEYKYIALADIGSQGEISSCTLAKGSELPTRARRIVHKGDVLVSSIEGSLQSCAIVPSEFDGALCSTGFYVIEPETMNAETLLILLKSENIQLLLKKGCSGTILTNISKEEFLKIRIPVLSAEIQSKIASLVQSSFSCRAESRQLLQNAKTLVEQEIEKQGTYK